MYCDCQPLPLFRRKQFVEQFANRNPEVIFSVSALAIRFLDEDFSHQNRIDLAKGYAETARSIVSESIFGGRVEISTLQSLCLLSLVDFTSKYASK
jgi:hypothetical protein